MNSKVKSFLSTDSQNWSLLVSRLALAITILPHGMQKALGMFGGYGLTATLGSFHSMGMPYFLGVLVILAEFAAPLALIIGAGTRFMAASIFIEMTGAMIIGGHIYNGFFMNWMGHQKGEGIEYFIMVLGLALALVIGGAGKFSVDGSLLKRMK